MASLELLQLLIFLVTSIWQKHEGWSYNFPSSTIVAPRRCAPLCASSNVSVPVDEFFAVYDSDSSISTCHVVTFAGSAVDAKSATNCSCFDNLTSEILKSSPTELRAVEAPAICEEKRVSIRLAHVREGRIISVGAVPCRQVMLEKHAILLCHARKEEEKRIVVVQDEKEKQEEEQMGDVEGPWGNEKRQLRREKKLTKTAVAHQEEERKRLRAQKAQERAKNDQEAALREQTRQKKGNGMRVKPNQKEKRLRRKRERRNVREESQLVH